MDAVRSISEAVDRAIDKLRNPLNSMPDFSSMSYRYGMPPANSRIPAWQKLRECERRWVYFKWAESLNDPAKAEHRIVLDDALSAYLLSYEATIQYIKDAFIRSPGTPDFNQWISARPEHDILVRGLRTLRHLEAHVEDVPIASLIRAVIGAGVSRTWKLPALHQRDLQKLRAPNISSAELQDWNDLVDQSSAEELLESSLSKLKAILSSAENVV
jgi:hypothetical protein